MFLSGLRVGFRVEFHVGLHVGFSSGFHMAFHVGLTWNYIIRKSSQAATGDTLVFMLGTMLSSMWTMLPSLGSMLVPMVGAYLDSMFG